MILNKQQEQRIQRIVNLRRSGWQRDETAATTCPNCSAVARLIVWHRAMPRQTLRMVQCQACGHFAEEVTYEG